MAQEKTTHEKIIEFSLIVLIYFAIMFFFVIGCIYIGNQVKDDQKIILEKNNEIARKDSIIEQQKIEIDALNYKYNH